MSWGKKEIHENINALGLTHPQVQPPNAAPSESPRNQQLSWDNKHDVIKWKLYFIKTIIASVLCPLKSPKVNLEFWHFFNQISVTFLTVEVSL